MLYSKCCCNTNIFKFIRLRRLSYTAAPKANNNSFPKIFSRENVATFSNYSVGILSIIGTISGINFLSSFLFQPTVQIAVLKTQVDASNKLAEETMKSVQGVLDANNKLAKEKMKSVQDEPNA